MRDSSEQAALGGSGCSQDPISSHLGIVSEPEQPQEPFASFQLLLQSRRVPVRYVSLSRNGHEQGVKTRRDYVEVKFSVLEAFSLRGRGRDGQLEKKRSFKIFAAAIFALSSSSILRQNNHNVVSIRMLARVSLLAAQMLYA